jgi:NAD(P)-dependent dehydrogenase (short-subunit alcohol dehydrogenase family)
MTSAPMPFKDKVTIVTGGGTGIGRATAAAFAAAGSRVVINGRNELTLRDTVHEISTRGGVASYVVGDVSRATDVEHVVKAAVDLHGRIDNLINNAAIDVSKPLAETTEDEWDSVLDVNLKGHLLCSLEVLPYMQRQGGGCIVNTSSVLGFAAMSGVASYCVSKAGIIALTRSMALEWTRLGVRVNCVAPGSTETAMMYGDLPPNLIPERRRAEQEVLPIGRLANPEEIAKASMWLCSPESSFMAGSTLVVDGGALTEYPAPRWSPDRRSGL